MIESKKEKGIVLTVKDEHLLLPYIQQELSGISRNKVKALLQHGCVSVNEKVITRHDFQLLTGMKVKIIKKNPYLELKNHYIKIIYEDQWILVIEKQPGILSMATNHHSFCVKTVLDQYLKRKKEKHTVHVVHRLDRETSGLMIYAKTFDVEKKLEEQWRKTVFDRRYIAVVSGNMNQTEGTITNWLKENKFFYVYSSNKKNDGKLATTHYKTIDSNEIYSLVELKLETGRKNQIRVHMQDIGHPVIGDIKYGAKQNPIGRLALHAFRLYFYHPVTGEILKFDTPIPPKFLKLMNHRIK